MRRSALTMLCALCFLAIGCAERDSSEDDWDSTYEYSDSALNPANIDQPGTPPAESHTTSVSIEVRSWSEFQEWVAAQKGKVVVVDVWSTSCDECIKEFPNFVKLHDRLGDQLACASFNIDYYGVGTTDDLEPRIMEFLTEKNATSSNFLSSTPDEDVMDALDVASIPATLVFDQSGVLKKTFRNDHNEYGPGGFNYDEHVNPLVKKLLETSG